MPCGSDNVLGVDVSGRTAAVREEQADIERFLADQARRRRLPYLGTMGGALATVALAVSTALT